MKKYTKFILFSSIFILFITCSAKQVRQSDLNSWKGRSVKDLALHPYFSSLSLEKVDLGDDKSLYNYRSVSLKKDGDLFKEISCSNQFIVSKNIVEEYRVIGECFTDCSYRPKSTISGQICE
jgi:hypothetical protein